MPKIGRIAAGLVAVLAASEGVDATYGKLVGSLLGDILIECNECRLTNGERLLRKLADAVLLLLLTPFGGRGQCV